MGDPTAMVYDNVAFADNYWRLDDWEKRPRAGCTLTARTTYAQFINDHHDG